MERATLLPSSSSADSWRRKRLRRDVGVEVLDEKPATGAQRRHHAAERRHPLGKVHERRVARARDRSGLSGSGSSTTLCRRTSTLAGVALRSSHRASRSVASTWPDSPTRVASQRATEPPPAPTSRQRHPSADAETVEMAERDRIEERRERAEPILRLERLRCRRDSRSRSRVSRSPGRNVVRLHRAAQAPLATRRIRGSLRPRRSPLTRRRRSGRSLTETRLSPGRTPRSRTPTRASSPWPVGRAPREQLGVVGHRGPTGVDRVVDLGDLLGVGARRRERPQLHHFRLARATTLSARTRASPSVGEKPAASTIASVFFCVFVQIASAFSMYASLLTALVTRAPAVVAPSTPTLPAATTSGPPRSTGASPAARPSADGTSARRGRGTRRDGHAAPRAPRRSDPRLRARRSGRSPARARPARRGSDRPGAPIACSRSKFSRYDGSALRRLRRKSCHGCSRAPAASGDAVGSRRVVGAGVDPRRLDQRVQTRRGLRLHVAQRRELFAPPVVGLDVGHGAEERRPEHLAPVGLESTARRTRSSPTPSLVNPCLTIRPSRRSVSSVTPGHIWGETGFQAGSACYARLHSS